MSSLSMAIDLQCLMYDGRARGDHRKHGNVFCANDDGGCGYPPTAHTEGDGDDDDDDGDYDYAPAA